MVAVAAVAATAAYIRRLRAELAAAKRDIDEFVAAAHRDKLQEQQPPPQQAPPAPVASAPAPPPAPPPRTHPTTTIDGRSVAGYMFVCTPKTEEDIEKYSLLGAPSVELGTLEQLVNQLPRAPLFVFNMKSRRLHGP